MKFSEAFQNHVRSTYILPALDRGDNTVRIKAGDVHRELHLVNRVPSVCNALASEKFQKANNLILVDKQGPPSGLSTTVVFTYRLASLENAGARSPAKKGRLEALYGKLADVFRELEGGEKYLRRERELLEQPRHSARTMKGDE
jgi:hypothetical protein